VEVSQFDAVVLRTGFGWLGALMMLLFRGGLFAVVASGNHTISINPDAIIAVRSGPQNDGCCCQPFER
jgi:hypothetical protein